MNFSGTLRSFYLIFSVLISFSAYLEIGVAILIHNFCIYKLAMFIFLCCSIS